MSCLYLIKHQKARTERNMKVPKRRASIRPWSWSWLLKRPSFGSSSVLIQLASVQRSSFPVAVEMCCAITGISLFNKNTFFVLVVRNTWDWQLPDGVLALKINSLL